MKGLKRTLILILALALALTVGVLPAAAANSATATTLRLAGASGSVTVKNASGKNQSVKTDMRLYSGYSVATGKSSAAYISLDGTKAVKLDSSSKATVKKSGSKLEVCLDSGSLFFNVTAPLASNESLNIRTSTMVTGIRGSYGWVTRTEVGLLHGHVTLTCINPVTGETRVAELYSGDRVYYDPSSTVSADPNLKEIDFIKEKITNKDIPAFVVEELRKDVSLQDPIIRDVPTVDVPKLLGDYDAIKAAEDAAIEEKAAELAEKLAEQQAAIISDRSDYLFTDDSSGGGGYTPTSYSVTLPTVQGMMITTSDPVSDIAPGTTFSFNVAPDSGYTLYEEYLNVTAGSETVSLADDGTGGFNASFTVNRNTSVTASGAVHQVNSFADAVSAFAGGDTYVELMEDDTSMSGYTIASGNTLIINTDAFVTLGDYLTNNGTIVINGGLEGTSGTLDNNGTINVIGSLIISGGTLNNYGTITNKEALEVGSGGTFNNYSGNTVENYGSLLIAGTFNNGDGATYSGRLVNYGTIEVSGELFNSSNGTLENKEDAVFESTGSFVSENNITNDGEMELSSFRLAEGLSFTNRGTLVTTSSFMNSGTFNNSGTLEVRYTFTNGSVMTNTGLIDSSSGTIDNGNGSDPATFDNSGEIRMMRTTSGALYNRANATFNNQQGGSITGYGDVVNYAEFINDGSMSVRDFQNIAGGRFSGNDPVVVEIYSFVFNLQMHSPDNYSVFSNQSIAEGQCAEEPSETPNDVDGYHFEGWYQESDCINEYDFSTPVMSGTMVYAKWVEI